MKNTIKFLIGLVLGIILYYIFNSLLFISAIIFTYIVLEPIYLKHIKR